MTKRRTIVSLEQALSLPYATLRFVQLGWRVIRIESFVQGDARWGQFSACTRKLRPLILPARRRSSALLASARLIAT